MECKEKMLTRFLLVTKLCLFKEKKKNSPIALAAFLLPCLAKHTLKWPLAVCSPFLKEQNIHPNQDQKSLSNHLIIPKYPINMKRYVYIYIPPLANVNPLINSTWIWKSDTIYQSQLIDVTFAMFC